MSDETWARVSLRIASQHLSSSEIEQLVGLKSIDRPVDSWAVDLTSDSAVGLNEQLSIVKAFLRERITTLEGLADGSEINLSIGWTPRNPQDGIIFDTELIALLSRIGCYVLLDTYLD